MLNLELETFFWDYFVVGDAERHKNEGLFLSFLWRCVKYT